MNKLKVNDEVVVLSGKDKGKTGALTVVNYSKKQVIVKGINLKKKAIKPSQENPNGGFLEIEKPFHISKVSLVSPKSKKATRVSFTKKDGKLVRTLTKCGTVLK